MSWDESTEATTPGGVARPAGLRKFRGGLTLVCGPPGAGKTTYARQHARPGDRLIDLDEIMSELSGLPMHQTGRQWLNAGLAERNRRLRQAADRTTGRTWFIIGAPRARERGWWSRILGTDSVVVLETDREECRRRCEADPARSRADKNYDHIVRMWWRKYGQRRGDLVITN